MKKNLFLIIMSMTMMAACEQLPDVEEAIQDSTEQVTQKHFTFTIKGDFNEDVATRSALSANGTEMSDLWMLDYVEGVMVQQLHLTSTDADFDHPGIDLQYGSHHVYIVVSRGTNPVLDAETGTIAWAKPSDTFWKDYQIDVTSSSSKNRSCTLKRVVTKLRISIQDELPATISTLSVSAENFSSAFDYRTGEPATAERNERTTLIPRSYIETSGNLSLSFFAFAASSKKSTDVTLTAQSTDGEVLGCVTIPNVTFVRNRTTECSGTLFSSSAPISIEIDDEWDASELFEW